ncbi:uncharacterized protein MEPE_02862 [Melanopsichium pennsylvanicum]|uniref:Uncharacterized protein n=1 Tax=Melanopsichium pennsylvanicum TaxID=63383 RepID=A0AAJ4XKR2_9BASI|nr:uncharacterized protein MEPE_02862 [Melanopsichium pennsylvanicum]
MWELNKAAIDLVRPGSPTQLQCHSMRSVSPSRQDDVLLQSPVVAQYWLMHARLSHLPDERNDNKATLDRGYCHLAFSSVQLSLSRCLLNRAAARVEPFRVPGSQALHASASASASATATATATAYPPKQSSRPVSLISTLSIETGNPGPVARLFASFEGHANSLMLSACDLSLLLGFLCVCECVCVCVYMHVSAAVVLSILTVSSFLSTLLRSHPKVRRAHLVDPL